MNAKGRNIPDLELVVVPHPIGTRARDEIADIGKQVAAQVLELLR